MHNCSKKKEEKKRRISYIHLFRLDFYPIVFKVGWNAVVKQHFEVNHLNDDGLSQLHIKKKVNYKLDNKQSLCYTPSEAQRSGQ